MELPWIVGDTSFYKLKCQSQVFCSSQGLKKKRKAFLQLLNYLRWRCVFAWQNYLQSTVLKLNQMLRARHGSQVTLYAVIRGAINVNLTFAVHHDDPQRLPNGNIMDIKSSILHSTVVVLFHPPHPFQQKSYLQSTTVCTVPLAGRISRCPAFASLSHVAGMSLGACSLEGLQYPGNRGSPRDLTVKLRY